MRSLPVIAACLLTASAGADVLSRPPFVDFGWYSDYHFFAQGHWPEQYANADGELVQPPRVPPSAAEHLAYCEAERDKAISGGDAVFALELEGSEISLPLDEWVKALGVEDAKKRIFRRCVWQQQQIVEREAAEADK